MRARVERIEFAGLHLTTPVQACTAPDVVRGHESLPHRCLAGRVESDLDSLLRYCGNFNLWLGRELVIEMRTAMVSFRACCLLVVRRNGRLRQRSVQP